MASWLRGPSEYRLQGVVHVGEGDEVPQEGENTVRVWLRKNPEM